MIIDKNYGKNCAQDGMEKNVNNNNNNNNRNRNRNGQTKRYYNKLIKCRMQNLKKNSTVKIKYKSKR